MSCTCEFKSTPTALLLAPPMMEGAAEEALTPVEAKTPVALKSRPNKGVKTGPPGRVPSTVPVQESNSWEKIRNRSCGGEEALYSVRLHMFPNIRPTMVTIMSFLSHTYMSPMNDPWER